MENELISVIIPVYNVEKYICKCVDSILEQSYTNIEIILVDDGSPDNCAMICDKYEKKDGRIKVVHKENGGLSSARNVGLEMSLGEYIIFIDSDDWIESTYIEKLYCRLKENNADIAVPAFCLSYENGIQIIDSRISKCTVYTSEESLENFLFNGYLTPCVASKLWKKSLWDEIRCPEGKLFEDQFTTYKLLMSANKVVYDPDVYYYYYKREGSIGHSFFSERTYDLLEGINEEYTIITSKYPNILDSMKTARAVWKLVFVNMMISSNAVELNTVKNIQKEMRKSIYSIIKCDYLPGIRKLEMLLFGMNFKLYSLMYREYKKVKSIA